MKNGRAPTMLMHCEGDTFPCGNALRHGYPCKQNRLRLASELHSRQSLEGACVSPSGRYKKKTTRLGGCNLDQCEHNARPMERLFASKKSFGAPLVSKLLDGLALLANSICDKSQRSALSPQGEINKKDRSKSQYH